MKSLTIGKLADACGLSADTIRFYEKRGLVQADNRSEGGYRLYNSVVTDRLRFIKRAKEVGFTLDEIRQLLLLMDDPMGSCAEVKTFGQKKLLEIDQKIHALSEIKQTLAPMLEACSGEGPRTNCSILATLNRKAVDR